MYDMLEKTARKPSADPAQEKLRQNKALWNKDVSAFVNDLIHLKKLMNGWPSKFFKERSRIGEPMPADPNVIIGSLASDFQDIAQRGNAIVSEQLEYSKTRRKKQPKAPSAPSPSAPAAPAAPATPAPGAPTTPDLTKQLAASFEQKYDLVAEGSNPISRFFAKLLTPTFGFGEAARIRRYRMALLKACVKTYKELGKLQVEIVKSSPESITSSNALLHQIWNDWTLVARGFITYKQNMPKSVPDAGGTIATPGDLIEEKKKEEKSKKTEERAEQDLHRQMSEEYTTEERTPVNEIKSVPPPAPVQVPDYTSVESMAIAKAIIQDYRKTLSSGGLINEPSFVELNNLIGNFMMAPNRDKPMAAKSLAQSYRDIVSTLNQKHGTSGTTLSQIAQSLSGKNPSVAPKMASDQLEATSQAFLKKWLGKTRHQLSLFDTTSSFRLDIYKMSTDVRQTLDQIMDHLEKDLQVDTLEPMITEVNRKITTLRGLMRSLHYGETGK